MRSSRSSPFRRPARGAGGEAARRAKAIDPERELRRPATRSTSPTPPPTATALGDALAAPGDVARSDRRIIAQAEAKAPAAATARPSSSSPAPASRPGAASARAALLEALPPSGSQSENDRTALLHARLLEETGETARARHLRRRRRAHAGRGGAVPPGRPADRRGPVRRGAAACSPRPRSAPGGWIASSAPSMRTCTTGRPSGSPSCVVRGLIVRLEHRAGEIERAHHQHHRRPGAVGVAGDPAERVGDARGGHRAHPRLAGGGGEIRRRVMVVLGDRDRVDRQRAAAKRVQHAGRILVGEQADDEVEGPVRCHGNGRRPRAMPPDCGRRRATARRRRGADRAAGPAPGIAAAPAIPPI